MQKTKIEYVDYSWNPIVGCSEISEGCLHCYAKRMCKRFGWPWKPIFHPERLEEPLHWKKPSRIFVCSMGDLFHDDVDGFWINAIWSIIERCYWHSFLILTKRPQRWERLTPKLPLYKNLWLGVSVENQKTADERIPILLQIPAAKRFVSVEPMLGPINLIECHECNIFETCPKIQWVICGGETGPSARPLHPDWVRSLRDQCQSAEVPFFFKRWGDYEKRYNKGSRYDSTNTDRLLDGREWNEFPK